MMASLRRRPPRSATGILLALLVIAAVGGEVKQPERNIPRAMLISLGIGLAVGRALARAMEGELTYSRDEGRTRFTLSLPIA